MIKAAAAIALMAMAGTQAPAIPSAKAGDTYEIRLDRESTSAGPNGSSGSTSDQDALIERVLAVRSDGLELEYDLPHDASADERRSQWQLPARVFRPVGGEPHLLDPDELERRVDPWLKSGGLTRASCGHLLFTWNAFQIDCDPQSALRIIKAFQLEPADLLEGTVITDHEGVGSSRLLKKSEGQSGAIYTAELKIDPNAIRRDLAQTDVGVGEISQKPVTLEAALQSHAADQISGVIVVTLELTTSGQVVRRVREARYTITTREGTSMKTATDTLERKRLS